MSNGTPAPTGIDPTQICKVCKFARNWNGGMVECHYNPPQWREVPGVIADSSGNLQPTAVWPLVRFTDWCGSFST